MDGSREKEFAVIKFHSDDTYSTCSQRNKTADSAGYVIGEEVSIQWSKNEVYNGIVVFTDDDRNICLEKEETFAARLIAEKANINAEKAAQEIADKAAQKAPKRRQTTATSQNVNTSKKKKTGISFEERGDGTVSLAPTDSISTSTPYSPTNVKVLQVMATFQQCQSMEERQLYIASLSAAQVGDTNSSKVSERNDVESTAGDQAISTGCVIAGRPTTLSPTNGTPIQHLHVDDQERERLNLNLVNSPMLSVITTISSERGAEPGGLIVSRGRGRGRGRMISFSASGLDVSDARSTIGRGWMGPMGRGRGGSLMEQSYIGIENDSATVRRLQRETEMWGTPITVSEERQCVSVISDISQFHDEHDFQLTSTPTQPRSPLIIPTVQVNSKSLPAVIDVQSCLGCKALQVSLQQTHSLVTAMEIKIIKLSEIIEEHNQRLNQISKHKINKSCCSQSDEIFTDQRLMRIKAAAFVTGRPISSHMCKQLVFNIYDNEPPSSFNSDDIKSINDRRECRDVQSLSKWAVFEMFSLAELVGRNCLGGGRDTSVGMNADIKKPFDEYKLQTIKTAVFIVYPQQNEILRNAAWMKCVDKINTDVRYLFKTSLKKHQWLQLGF